MLATPQIKHRPHTQLEDRQPRRVAQYLLLYLTWVFIYEGQPYFFVFQNLYVTTLSPTYKYSGSPEGSLHFIRRIYGTRPTSTQPVAVREKHDTFPHGLPSVAPQTNLNSCLYPRLLFPLELHRIKSCLLLCLSRFYTSEVSGKCAKTAHQGFHVVVRA